MSIAALPVVVVAPDAMRGRRAKTFALPVVVVLPDAVRGWDIGPVGPHQSLLYILPASPGRKVVRRRALYKEGPGDSLLFHLV